MEAYTATYSPDDNKLRLYSVSRLDAETYARVKVAGFKWAPQQQLFVAPMWTPSREDLLLELCGEIDDEDTSLIDRAEERAERFEDYSERRGAEAEGARKAVSAIADNIPFGQPILVGHHSEKRARKDAERIENGMRKAIKLWETSEYWTRRAAGALRHAKYKERPDVRARRIKTLEAAQRKSQREKADSEKFLRAWTRVFEPEYLKRKDGSELSNKDRALYLAGAERGTGLRWSRLRDDKLTPEEAREQALTGYAGIIAWADRWISHYENRLAYERAMLGESGGTVADRTGPEKGGACRCWASPRGGWSYIQKINKVSVTVLDNWGNAGRNFTRTIPFNNLKAVMTKAQVEDAREQGRIEESPDGLGFWLLQSREEFDRAEEARGTPNELEKPKAKDFEAMRETIRAGVQIVSAPTLFPTPRELAARMVDLAEIEPGHRVLEPSAGTGNLLGAMGGRMFGHAPERGEVVAVELNLALANRLQAEFPKTEVHQEDFLACYGDLGTFDRIVMNPPFDDASDIKHIRHALEMLKPGGRLVALCANGPRQRAAFRESASHWEDLPAGTFEAQGTRVNVALLVIDA